MHKAQKRPLISHAWTDVSTERARALQYAINLGWPPNVSEDLHHRRANDTWIAMAHTHPSERTECGKTSIARRFKCEMAAPE